MKFNAAVTAVVASLVIGSASAATALVEQPGNLAIGNDVSYPQCDVVLPSGQAFGIVAVNEGLPNTTNPCLADEIGWAQLSFGTTRQPKASLYVNTADPGNDNIADWPATNNDPLGGSPVHDPYGTCSGRNDPACAWQYGWNLAEMDAQTRGVSDPGSYRWWLDVETINSWESSAKNNRADLEGMASYFRHIGAGVGIYSTTSQWDPLVGSVPRGSPLYRLPEWRPGAKTLSQAKKNCRLARLTGGGIVAITQWKTPSENFDFSCLG